MKDYKDVLFYGFILGIVWILWFLIQYLEHRRDQKDTEKLFYTKEERDAVMKKNVSDALL